MSASASLAANGAGPAEKRRARIRNAVPVANLRMMLAIAADHGVSPEQVLAGSGLTLALLETPDLRITAVEAARVMSRLVELTHSRAIGVEFGLRTTPTAHGYLGYAAMACGTIQEALELVIRYLHLRQQDVRLRLHVDDTHLLVEARDNHEIGPFRSLIYEGLLIGLVRMFGFLIGEAQPECELWFDWPERDYYAAYRSRLPPLRFGMPVCQIRLPRRYLERRLLTAEPGTMKKAVAECEREMATAAPPAENLIERVRAELRPGTDGYPSLETVASCLFMSGRTLKRKLEARGSSFQTLLDEVRHRDALRLLENPDLDIQQIATVLGYKDPPSFTRAFKCWSGHSPSEMRGPRSGVCGRSCPSSSPSARRLAGRALFPHAHGGC